MPVLYCKGRGCWHIAGDQTRAFGLLATKTKCGMRTLSRATPERGPEPLCPYCLKPDPSRVARIDKHFARPERHSKIAAAPKERPSR